MKDSYPKGMELKWTLLLIAIIVTMFIGGEACRTECDISAWYPWDCSRCCRPTHAPDDAYRGKTICCGNITDPNECLKHCQSNGFNENVGESGQCQKVCPSSYCKTTTITTPLPLTKLTKVPKTQTRTRQPLTNTASSTGIHDLPPTTNSNTQKDSALQACNNGDTTILYWTIPVIAILATVICVQCYIAYRLQKKTRHIGKVQDTSHQRSTMKNELEDV